MESIHFSCRGESHISSGKVCQDYSYSHVYEYGMAVAIVCDGHGGRRYFRSDVGARIAAEVTERKIRTFAAEAAHTLLKGSPFGQIAAISTQIERNDFTRQTEVERAFRRLAGSIIFEWDNEVKAHAASTPLLEEDKADLDPKWIDDFNSGLNLEKVYGCTLIACVCTPDFWFGFQIGDGKCFAVDDSGQWTEPIPWDDRCFLNKTTSICDTNAVDEFRFCYQGDGFPIAIILASDGLDDSFGTPENQANFYIQILKSICTEGVATTLAELQATLPQLSKIGSRDDMSLAMIFSSENLHEIYPKLISWQIADLKRLIADEDEKLAKAHKIQQSFDSIPNPTRQDQIALQYANSDEKRALAAKATLEGRLAALLSELNPTEKEEPTEDEIEVSVEENSHESNSRDEYSDRIVSQQNKRM